MQQKIEQAVSPIAYMAGGLTTVWGFNAAEWGIFGIMAGIAIGVCTLIMNFYFKSKALKNGIPLK